LDGHNNEILGKWNPLNQSSYPYAIRFWNEQAVEENKNKIFNLRYDSPVCNHNPLITGSCQITRDEWHHLVLVKDGNVLMYYQDGVSFGNTTDNTTSTCNTTNNNPIYLGKRDSNRRYFTGAIDDIEFYDRALVLNEINLLFFENGWSPPPPPEVEILSMSLPNQLSSNINNTNQTINIIVPCYMDVTALAPTFTVTTGAQLSVGVNNQKSSITVNNYTSPVNYTVTNDLYCISNDWTVTVINHSLSDSEAKKLTSFTTAEIQEQIGIPEIDTINNIILFEITCQADISALYFNFSLDSGTVASLENITLTSSEIFDFTKPLIMNLANQAVCANRNWTLSVNRVQYSQNDILNLEGFYIPNVITPNDDNKNETFKIGEFLIGSAVTIFNRYGISVYRSENYLNDFSGANLSSGVYYYAIDNECYGEIIKGELSILR
jgi:gliding motility-associated-like protein